MIDFAKREMSGEVVFYHYAIELEDDPGAYLIAFGEYTGQTIIACHSETTGEFFAIQATDIDNGIGSILARHLRTGWARRAAKSGSHTIAAHFTYADGKLSRGTPTDGMP
jgi:hypothetical protein